LIFGLLALVVAAVVAIVVVVVTRPHARAVSQADPGPVLLVPGYGGSTTGLDVLAGYLRSAGKDVTVVALPDGGQGDLNVQAQTLATSVAAVLRRTGAPSVDVVGYSAGGVVARLWVRDHGGASKARRVITLGSPHHGTDVAGLAGSLLPSACPVACQQLSPSSSLLAGLNAGDETPSGPTFVSVWTTHDDVVLPPDSASLQGAVDFTVQSVCPNDQVQHSGLPSDPVVEAIVAAELGAGPPIAQVTGVRCP
jgi:triacylglycerol esterase/lipase EstA (alpha/beta hydrolase family)